MNIQSIDFQPLIQWINETLGLDSYELGIDFSVNLSGRRPSIVSPNLVEYSGVFKACYSTVTVDFFNFNSNETGEIWATIYLNYEHKTRGSNGSQIGTCWHSPIDGWTFENK